MKRKFEQVVEVAFFMTLFACAIVFVSKGATDIYKSLLQGNTVESFEVERGGKSLTCVTSWVATQATMSCLPTQWMEAEVVYDQADFEAPAP